MKAKKPFQIKSISFYYDGERKTVRAQRDGTFRLPVSFIKNGKLKTQLRDLTAKQVVEHDIIKNCDPVLTLSGGEKIRVFVNGDSSYLPAGSEGALLKHDDYQKKKRKLKKDTAKLKETIIPPYSDCPDMEQLCFPWCDYDDDVF